MTDKIILLGSEVIKGLNVSVGEELSKFSNNNYETFIEYVNQTQSTRLTGYRNKVTDLIASDGIKTSEYTYGKNINIDEAKIEGVTLTSDWNIDNYLFGLSYDYQNAKDNSGKTNDGRYLPDRKSVV